MITEFYYRKISFWGLRVVFWGLCVVLNKNINDELYCTIFDLIIETIKFKTIK